MKPARLTYQDAADGPTASRRRAVAPLARAANLTDPTPGGKHGHVHRCSTCGEAYQCAGPDETGRCAPVCAACYWVELGSQLRIYRSVVAELTRKRRALGKTVGRAACARAKRSRGKFAQHARLLAGFGQVVALPRAETATGDTGWKSRETEGEFGAQGRSTAGNAQVRAGTDSPGARANLPG
jgi:hypothetical protein